MELTARNAEGRWLASDLVRHIVSPVKTPYTCELVVPDDANDVTVGGRLSGGGCAWFRNFELAIVDGSDAHAVDLTNTDFSQDLEAWVVAARGSTVTAENGELRVEQDTEQVDRLFDALPDLGEATEESIGAGLIARVPLALSTDDASRTGSPAHLAGLQAALAETSTKNDEDPAVRAAAVVVTWNVFQHFYPYFDVVPLDWTERLSDAFEDALEKPAEHELADVLTRVLVPLSDAHLHVIPPRSAGIRALPLRMRRLEDQVVVITSVHGDVRMGDQVLAIDEVPIDVAFERELAKISGSPWWRQSTAALMLSYGPSLSTAKLDLLRDGQRITAHVLRERRDVPPRLAAEPIERLDDGVFVIDLDRAPMSAITDQINEIAAAPGVVFDARGYPNSNDDVLKHLLDAPDEAGAWMNVAHVLRPDHRDVAGWTNYGWNLQPAEPRIRGKVAYLIGPDAVSYAESCMSIVEHYRLGEIVGEPTAGTNGNTAFFGAPGDLTVTFTGMQVVKLDGSQHHLVGIQPTVPVSPTVAGVRAGRDEVLERALEIVRST